MSIYIRLFNNTELGLSDKKIPLGYFPWEMRVALQKSKIPHDHFIICPVYKHTKKEDISDIQPGITGHVEGKETHIEAFSREAGEEIGLIPNIPLEPVFTSKKFTIYSVNITDCSKVSQSNVSKYSDYKPLTVHKIGGFIHGVFNDVLEYISSPIHRSNNIDLDIIGLSIISKSDIEKSLHIN
jgi:hypothetical protein